MASASLASPRLGSGGGGGLDLRALPFGFIHEEQGRVVFTEVDARHTLEPAATTKRAFALVRKKIEQLTATVGHG